jgi:TolB protein
MKASVLCLVLAYAVVAAASAASNSTRTASGTSEIAYTECAKKDTDYCNLGQSAVYSMRVDGSHRRLLARMGREPAWSPDGRYLAYVYDGIWIVRADGTRRRRLTTPDRATRTIDGGPAWSPDGRRIVFSRNWIPPGDSQRTELYVVSVASVRLRLLTGTRTRHEGGPGWSPDGRVIAFGVGSGLRPRDNGLYLLDLASGRTKRLTSGPDGGPDWSPDGRTIAFASGYERRALYLIKPNGMGKRTIVAPGKPVAAPSWSPNGSKIAYARAVGDARASSQILIVGAGGKGSRLLLRGATEPDWRPNPPGVK